MPENQQQQQQTAIVKRLADLPSQKRDAVLSLLQKQGIDPANLPIWSCDRTTDHFPLSWTQEQLWLIDQLEGPSPTYNFLTLQQVEGTLNVDALQQTLNMLVQRHEILRTTFQSIDGEPRQVIHASGSWPFSLQHWPDEEATDRLQENGPENLNAVAEMGSELQALIQQEAARCFDLATGPLVQATLIKRSPTNALLLLNWHHIIWDWWSMGCFGQEFSHLYQAYSQGRSPQLPTLSLQYVDYACWQRHWLQVDSLSGHLDYWRQQLAQSPALLELPTDYPRPAVQTFRGSTHTVSLSLVLTHQLKALAQQQGVTLFMLLLAVFQILLHRYSGQTDILVGTPIANRQRPELESLLGFFVNTLVLRTQIDDTATVAELIQTVKAMALDAYTHQDVPFEQVVEALQPQRSLAYSPIFQVMFVLQNVPLTPLALDEVTLMPLSVGGAIAKFDLTLLMTESNQGLVANWEYNSDLFAANTIGRMATHFENLLEAIVSDVSQPLATLSLLSQIDRHQLLVEWNDTKMDYPQHLSCIHQLFEAQVERTAHAIAVVTEEEQLTYQDLNIRANQLASYLRELGVGPDVLVGVYIERSSAMVVSLLGILKAGGAYVPLDPSYPQQRLQFIVKDAQVSILLTQSSLLDRLPEHQAHIICLDRDWCHITQSSSLNPKLAVSADNLAYVIYTSGSTGTPKGVMNQHAGICNRLLWMQHVYQLTPSDRVLQKTPFSFDVSVWEFFWPLSTGARLIMAKPEGHRDSQYLTELMAQQQITTVHFVPSMLAVFLQEPTIQTLTCLKRVICSGEALPLQLQQDFFTVLDCELHNLYGPTEAAIDVTAWPCQSQSDSDIVPIGRPIANIQTYILDKHLQPLPIGVSGELHIGGIGLARGYLNRPELTAEKFISHPFGTGKLYKTGDLARYLPDGTIEFLGRLDHQVKIRGVRIELGEIESVLNRYGPVQHSVVIAHKDSSNSPDNQPSDNTRLIAYVANRDDIGNEDIGNEDIDNKEIDSEDIDNKKIDIAALKTYLKQQLPEYMVPKVIIPLETFPLTPNGKIDRRALPIPTGEFARIGDITPPQTERQIALIKLFAETLALPIEHVGIHDSFFELGGHSLSATHLAARMREEFKAEVPLRMIFESPTVEELDSVLTYDLTPDVLVSAIKPMDRDSTPIPLSHAQERLWFLSQLESTSASYNIPTAIHITGPVDPDILQCSLDALVERHEILRTTFPLVEGEAIQHIAPTRSIPVQMIESSTIINPMEWLEQEAQQPFNVMTGPLMRVTLIRLAEDKAILAVTMHHIISDGWSLGILIHELTEFYKAHRGGESISLPPLPIQYADYALWQRKWQHESAIKQQLVYWQQQLSDAPALLQLPTDRPRPARSTFQGQQQRLTLNTRLSQQLRSLSQQSGITLFMTLLTAFAILLSRLSGQKDILIGSPIVNRNQLELESLIGFFVNTLVLRIDLSGEPNVSDLLQQVKQTTLDAYTHQDIPFEKLVAELQPERHLDRNPLFQVFFNMVNLPRQGLEIPGLALNPVPVANLPTKFDLTLYVEEPQVNEHPPAIQLELLYSTELFDADRVAEMLAQFQHLLEQIVHEPDRSTAELSLVTPQSHQILPHSTGPLPEPTYDPVTVDFNRVACETPENTAISQGTHSWTYGQLSSCADRIRHTLHHHRINPNDVVAVTGIRSFGFIAAVLAVLQRGAVLLTIDPALPTARQSQMLSDAQAKCLLHCNPDQSEEWGEGLNLNLDIQYIQIDPDTGNSVGQGTASDCQIDTALDVEIISPDQAAYIFFTSGTTGTPKGILGSHKGLAHFLHWQRQTFTVKRSDRIAQLTGLSFDVLLRDIFLPLTSGATLCLPDPRMKPGDPDMMDWLVQQRITLLHTVPTLAQAWLTTLSEFFVAGPLRGVFFAGEPLSDQLVNDWRRVFPRCQDMINLYGPTETTLAKAYYQVPAEPVPGIQPIGQPLPDTQLWVLNPQGQPAGIGEIGEIVIRTPFRTLGYINASQGERHRFQPNPFSNDPNDIIYYTGDFGRYQPNGTLDILGRRDHQVKIRGVRIELGEIENALAGHSHIHHAIATMVEQPPGNQYLAAYVVPHAAQTSQTSLQPESLRQYLKQRLPDYMLPSVFVVLDHLPLTTNGKVNRKALPLPPALRDTPDALVAPQTETQRLIAACFATVLFLPVEQIGLYDSFFILGGHSLLAMQLMMRLRDTFEVELPLRKVFESPTVAALEAVLTSDFAPGQIIPAIIPIEQDGTSIPLSYAQERLWFLAQLEGLSATYNLPAAVQIEGSLDINALEHALEVLVTRHDVLRTTFPIVNGTAVQKIAPSLHIPLQSIAASTLTSTPSDWLIQETQCPFDLEQGPLLRVKLLHLSKDTSVLTVIMHHIISDGWSVGVFIRELTTLYKAYRQGQPCPFPSLPIQYVDYTFWQRQWLHGEVLDTQLNYWRQQLSQIPTLLELPTDHPRPAVQRSHGRTYTSTLPLSLSEQIKALAQEQGVTTFMTLLAAFQVLLYRYSGQQDILVGTPIANRQRPELESLIGFFVNTLVLRTQIQPTASVTDLLCQVKRMALDAYAHQDVPFEQVVEMLQPDRTLAHAPLFQVMFVLQNMPMASIELPDLTLTPLAAETVTAKFDLTLSMEDTEQGLVGRWEYNSDLFEPNTITRMAAHFETLLHAMVKDRSQSIATLPLLSTAERSQLLGEWNNTAASYPQSQCIHQLFEAQVEKTPDAVAVVFEGQSITYKILNAQANQLAHYLQDLGVRPEMLVGICLERSIDMIVGLLGILKAGGAYVPLDPNYPPQRLQFMLRDAQVTVLVTQKSLLETLPEHHVRTVCLRRDKDSLAQASEANLRNQITASNLAYMIYTSGSTGRPKGVMIPHSNLVNAYVAWEKAYQLRTEVHSHLQMASFSFDVFTGDWVRALCSGGKLVLCPRSLLLEPEKLYFLLQQEKIDCAEFVPAVLRSLMDYLGATHQDLHFMRLLAVGSDSWYLDEFHKLGCLCGDASRIINSYGVTEATIDSSYFETTPLKLSSQQLVPIGRPFANSQLYILDTHLNPVPIGVTGELYIGGPGVARGYWNLPELTASRFIPIPFGKSSDDHRIYRTGDQARYLPDGNIELLGRVDHQVKIRGYRIELGAIESLLNQLEEVQQSVVITHGDSADNRRLVTYLVSDGDIEINSLKRYLKQHLPDYMVPNIVIPLATLPLTPNGKIDRQALPCPTGPFLQQNSYVAPRNTTELTLTQLWSDVLNVDPISVQATFFDLGGHSLLAVRLMAKIQTTFQIDLPLATLFQYPTVEQLAQQLAVGSRAEDIALVPIQPQGNCLPLFCIHPVGGNVLCYQALSQHLGQDYPVYGLQSLGLAGQQSPLRTIEAMASHYLEEIMAVQPRGPYRLIGWSMGGVIAYEMAQQLTHRGESVELLGLIDGYSYIPPVNGEPVENQNHLLAELIKDLAGQTGRPVPSELYSFKAQSISLEQALDLLQKHQFLPDHMPLDQLGRLWQVFQANTQALYQYRPQPYNGSALLLVASESLMHAKEPDVNGWQQADWNTIISELDVHTITADHFSLVTESSNVAQVVQYLKQNLISVHLSAR